MDNICREQLRKFVLVHLDDILIFSRSPEEHAKHLRIVLDILRTTCMPICPSVTSIDLSCSFVDMLQEGMASG